MFKLGDRVMVTNTANIDKRIGRGDIGFVVGKDESDICVSFPQYEGLLHNCGCVTTDNSCNYFGKRQIKTDFEVGYKKLEGV